MRIGLLTTTPEHPLLAATASLLIGNGHRMESLSPDARPPDDPADVYLLKARTPAAIALARALEQQGVPVLNSAAATEFCQDRVAMAELAELSGLPFPTTTALANLGHLTTAPTRPLVIKSRHSRRGDLVARVDTAAELRGLIERWPDEPVVVQDLAPTDGWDHKLWVVADRVFAAQRHSELAKGPHRPERAHTTPHPWSALALRVGEVFGLDVYGVDILQVDGKPLIVDVNAFPGMRGQRDAPAALAARVLAAVSGTSSRKSGWRATMTL